MIMYVDNGTKPEYWNSPFHGKPNESGDNNAHCVYFCQQCTMGKWAANIVLAPSYFGE